MRYRRPCSFRRPFPLQLRGDRGVPVRSPGHIGVNARKVIHRSCEFSKAVDQPVDNFYFHWVETTNPVAMKPKPTTMFQLPNASIGREPSVT